MPRSGDYWKRRKEACFHRFNEAGAIMPRSGVGEDQPECWVGSALQ